MFLQKTYTVHLTTHDRKRPTCMVSLPPPWIEQLDVREGDEIEFWVDGDGRLILVAKRDGQPLLPRKPAEAAAS